MPNIEEQRLDIIEYSDYLLQNVLKPFDQVDDTPEGRMITQLKWLKEHAENHDLQLPVDQVKLSTLRYVYTDGELCRHASDPDDAAKVWTEVERPLDFILKITKHGRLLIKPEFYPYIIQMTDLLFNLLKNAQRKLSKHEFGLISELETLKRLLQDNKVELPFISYLPDYHNFNEVYVIFESSIDDLPNGKYLCKTVANLIFEGIRPDTWLTLEDAKQDIINLK